MSMSSVVRTRVTLRRSENPTAMASRSGPLSALLWFAIRSAIWSPPSEFALRLPRKEGSGSILASPAEASHLLSRGAAVNSGSDLSSSASITLRMMGLDRMTSTSLSTVAVSALRSERTPSIFAMVFFLGSIWTTAAAS